MNKEQAIELLEHLVWDKDNEGNCYGKALQMAIDALKQPEIVHCCECLSYGKSLSGKYMCLAHCTYPQPNHYCAEGIRKTDGKTT